MTVFGPFDQHMIIVSHSTRTSASRREARGRAAPDGGPAPSDSEMSPFDN